MKRLAITIIAILFWLSLSPQRVQAFWNEDVSYDQTQATASITIGAWLTFETWVEGGTYEAGDIVEWNGNFYTRTSRGGTVVGGLFPPDSFLGWIFWEPE
jgi:hypothetical protein